MIALEAPLRLATEADAHELSELVNFAGDSLPLYLWTRIAKDGEDPWDIGRARQAEKAREGGVVVIDRGDGAIACLMGYEIGAAPIPIADDSPPLLRPLQELENRALNSWYVNVLACYLEFRGRGLGSRLLQEAEKIGWAADMRQMSVIVASGNIGARRLYQRHGYDEIDTRPCVRDGWVTDIDSWVLLMKKLS
jgi:ribosomal protein S18 acetylase RimI-like enzyme